MITVLLACLGVIGGASVLLGFGFFLMGIFNYEKDLAAWGAAMVLTPIFVATVAILSAA